jgi:hypothetical protein
LIDYHYLDAKQKSDFALLSMLLPEIAEVLAQHPTEASQRVAWASMSRRFHQTYARALKENPDLVAMASKKENLKRLVFADAEALLAITTEGFNQPPLPPAPLPLAPGPVTRLNAVDVSAVEVEAPPDPWYEQPVAPSPVYQPEPAPAYRAESVAAHPLVNVVMPKSEIITATAGKGEIDWDLIGDLAKNLRSSLVIGVPGAGKGMLMSHFVRRVKALYPELQIVGIDPKNDAKETGYWTDGFDKVFRANNEAMDNQSFVEWLQTCLDSYRMMQDGKLLIWDEHTISCRRWASYDRSLAKGAPGQRFNEIIDYIISVCSSGDSRRNYIIAVGQVPNASDMGMSGGTRGIFKPVGIVSNNDRAAVQQFMSTTFTPAPPDGLEGLYRIMDKSPVGRAIFCWNRGKWEPMPRLENLSGYDRDTRQQIAPIPEPVETTPAPGISPASDMGPQLDLFEATPRSTRIDRAIAKCTAPLTKEVLEWLRGIGPGNTFVASSACTTAWAQKAEKQGHLTRKAQSITEKVIEPLAGMGLVKRDGTSWRVCE